MVSVLYLCAGVAADLSHVETPAKVKGYIGEDQLAQALEGSEVVVIPAGVPRKPGTYRLSSGWTYTAYI